MMTEVDESLHPALELRLVSAYLSSKGWQATKEGEVVNWSHPKYPNQVIGHSTDILSADLAQQLAGLEQRSDSHVLVELRHADADLLRITPMGAGPDTLHLEQGSRLLRGVQRLLTAAARTVMEPMPSLVGK